MTGHLMIAPHDTWHGPESLGDIGVKSAEEMRDVLTDRLRTNVTSPGRDRRRSGETNSDTNGKTSPRGTRLRENRSMSKTFDSELFGSK